MRKNGQAEGEVKEFEASRFDKFNMRDLPPSAELEEASKLMEGKKASVEKPQL